MCLLLSIKDLLTANVPFCYSLHFAYILNTDATCCKEYGTQSDRPTVLLKTMPMTPATISSNVTANATMQYWQHAVTHY